MSRLHSWLQDALFYLCIIPLVLGMCALYWLCRICGVRLEDDF